MTQDRIFMIKLDISLTLILILFKFTIAPEMSWWLVFSPMIITFIIGFIKGFNDGLRDKYQE